MTEAMIPPFKVDFTDTEIAFVTDAAERIMRSGQLVLGPYTAEFEAAIADMAQTEHAVAVNSGSTALEITYKTLDVLGRQVLVPTNTNFATAAAAKYAGAKVELYDSGLYPNTNDLEARLDEDTAAVVVVHVGGYITPEMEDIVERCKMLGVPLVEDAAHAHGALLGGKAAGSFGHAAAFSFFPTKTLTTSEGGVITTNDAEIAAKARQYRDQGKNPDGVTHEIWGNSWRLTEMGAALGLAQMEHQERDAARRAAIITRYEIELGGTGLEFPAQRPDSRPGGYKCIGLLPEGVSRLALKETLRSDGILLGKEVYERPLHRQPIFQECTLSGPYSMANDFADRHICLPLWRFIEDDAVTRVVSGVQSALR